MFEDMERISLIIREEEISQMSKTDLKTIVKTKMRRHVLDELNTIKGGHNKVRGSVYGLDRQTKCH